MTFLLPFRLHDVILSHVHGSHGVFASVQDLVRITEIVNLASAFPVHMWMGLDWVAHITHLVLQTSWILFNAWSDFSDLSLFPWRICFFNWRRSCYFLCNHSARTACLCSNTWLARSCRVGFLERTIKVSASLQVSLGEYNVSVCSRYQHVIITTWLDTALVLLFLCGCRTLLGSH